MKNKTSDDGGRNFMLVAIFGLATACSVISVLLLAQNRVYSLSQENGDLARDLGPNPYESQILSSRRGRKRSLVNSKADEVLAMKDLKDILRYVSLISYVV